MEIAGVYHGTPEVSIQQLPCKVGLDGAAAVDTFFRVEDVGTHKRTTFRGRLLLGSITSLPEGTHGRIVVPSKDVQGNETWECEASFKDIVYWNHDIMPSEMDESKMWLGWIDISRAIHSRD